VPKPLNSRCFSCAALTPTEARQRSCWDDVVCHNRRSHYRRRLAQQAIAANSPDPAAVPILEVPLPDAIYAVLYCYLTEDQRLHAVTAELYRGDAIVAKTAPTHVGGLTERVINLYLRNVLDAFSTHITTSIALFRDKVELPLNRHACPVADCPLGGLFGGGLSGDD
jgi:hypothetical protein